MGLESDGTVHQGKLIMRHRRNSEGEVEPLKGAAGSASPRPPNGAKGAGGRGRRNSVGADAEKLSEEMEMARQEVERTAGEALVHESSAMLHRGQAARDSVMAQKQQEAAMIRQQMEEQRKELIQKEKEEEERRKGVHEGVRKQRRASLVAVENLHTLKEEEAKALREQAMKTQAEAQAQLESVVFSRVMSQESDLQTVLAQRSTFSSGGSCTRRGGRRRSPSGSTPRTFPSRLEARLSPRVRRRSTSRSPRGPSARCSSGSRRGSFCPICTIGSRQSGTTH